MNWLKWCRLCAKEEGDEIDVFIKEENFPNMSDAIQKYFSVLIQKEDELPTKICSICNDFVLDILNFSVKINKVQQMYLDLENISKIESIPDVKVLRAKYGIEIFQNVDFLYNEIASQKSESFQMEMIESNTKEDKDSISINQDLEKTLYFEEEQVNLESVEIKNEEKDLFSQDKNPSAFDTKIIEKKDTTDISIDKEVCKSSLKKRNVKETKKKNCAIPDSTMKTHQKKKIKRKYRDDEKSLQCEECSMKFVRESNLSAHLKKAHNIVKELPPCEYCGKICKTKQKLKFHRELHLPKEERQKLLFKCPLCEQTFTQKGAMRSHIRGTHLHERPFICEACGKTFTSQSNLWAHRKKTHEEDLVPCEICHKICKNSSSLRKHMASHKEPSVPCSICGILLKSNKTLKNHMLVHSDLKAFQCNYCGKEFKRDITLQLHMIIHSGLKPYACRFCEQTFANPSNCKKHEKHSHPSEYQTAEGISGPTQPQRVLKKLPNIKQLKAMLEDMKANKEHQ